MERDAKGRFVKGNTHAISADVARDMQLRSAASRLANKRGAELVQAMLAGAVKDPKVIAALEAAGYDTKGLTNEIAIHARQIEKAQKTGDTKAYTALMKAAGYDTLNIKTDGPQVIVVSQQSVEASKKWGK